MDTKVNWCWVVAVVLFLLAAVLAFDTERHFHIILSPTAPAVAPNMVRALAALGFCIGGGCAVIAAVISQRRPV